MLRDAGEFKVIHNLNNSNCDHIKGFPGLEDGKKCEVPFFARIFFSHAVFLLS
jgi:hypothetical protein